MEAEGWYKDPFEQHEDRWFSDGRPTSLVRDGGVEAEDAPLSLSYDGDLVEAVRPAPADGEDLLRADAAQAELELTASEQVQAITDAAVTGPTD